MADQSNMDKFFEAQFQAARKLWENNDDAYEGACLRLLADPALPRYRRVTLCVSLAKSDPEYSLTCHEVHDSTNL